jgi:hypothetical protein
MVFTYIMAADAREENRNLRKQLEILSAANIEPKQTQTVSVPLASTPDAELVRLRGEVTTLRMEKKELEKLRAENQNLRVAQAEEKERARAEVAAAAASVFSRMELRLERFCHARIGRLRDMTIQKQHYNQYCGRAFPAMRRHCWRGSRRNN